MRPEVTAVVKPLRARLVGCVASAVLAPTVASVVWRIVIESSVDVLDGIKVGLAAATLALFLAVAGIAFVVERAVVGAKWYERMAWIALDALAAVIAARVEQAVPIWIFSVFGPKSDLRSHAVSYL